MPAASDAQVTQTWLRSTWHIQVPRTWLDACVEWVLEEAGGVAVPQTQLNQQVLDQWLLTDLCDLAHPILPDGVSETEKMELNGYYCLQMDSLLDVSQPAYSQLQRVRGADCTNEQVTAVTQATQRPWEAKPTRMLMLQLTDGVQTLEGMEYQPVPALHANLPPGTKLQLVGKVLVRLGVLLLKSENVRVLGGEVEQLVERHSQVRVLCRNLGLPEEDHAQGGEPDDQDLLASVEAAEEPQIRSNTLDSGYDSTGGSLISQTSVRTQSFQSEPSLQMASGPGSSNVVDLTGDDFPDNFDYIPEDFNEIPENSENVPEDFDDIPVEELDSIMTPTEVLTRNGARNYSGTEQYPVPDSDLLMPDSQAKHPIASGSPSSNSIGRSKGSSDRMAITGASDDSLSSPQAKMARYEPVSSSTQIIAKVSTHKHANKAKADMSVLNYLCVLQNGIWPPSAVQVVRLKAFIVTLIGNLRVTGGEWKLEATISDGTGYLNVDLCDGLLTNLIGFSATESRALRKDPARRGALDAGIQNCQRELVDMCCVMSVQLEPSGKNVLLRTDPLTDREYCELQKRVT